MRLFDLMLLGLHCSMLWGLTKLTPNSYFLRRALLEFRGSDAHISFAVASCTCECPRMAVEMKGWSRILLGTRNCHVFRIERSGVPVNFSTLPVVATRRRSKSLIGKHLK